MSNMDTKNFDVFVTITGFAYFPNTRRLCEGEYVNLVKEPENPKDPNAIAVYGDCGQIGYIANNNATIKENTISAERLSELMSGSSQKAMVVECTYHDAICKVEGAVDVDKIILTAFEKYNSCEYNEALSLYLMLKDKYETPLLLQYIADCYIKIGQSERAIDFLKKAIEKEPDDKVSLMMYAAALENMGELALAAEQYERLLEKTDNKEVEEGLKRCKRGV